MGLSLGVNYESERVTNADVSTQVKLPSYTRTDVGVYYEAENYRLAFNVENMLDEKYYTSGSRDTRIYPGTPRQVSLTYNVYF